MASLLFIRLGKLYKEGLEAEDVLAGLASLLPQIVTTMATASPAQQKVLAAIIRNELFSGRPEKIFDSESDIHVLLSFMAPKAYSSSDDLAESIEKMFISKNSLP